MGIGCNLNGRRFRRRILSLKVVTDIKTKLVCRLQMSSPSLRSLRPVLVYTQVGIGNVQKIALKAAEPRYLPVVLVSPSGYWKRPKGCTTVATAPPTS